jgi:hypothetical protein
MQDLIMTEAVVDWAVEHPEAISIFQTHGIDY